MRQHAVERGRKRHALGGKRRQIEVARQSARAPPRPTPLRGTAPGARPRARAPSAPRPFAVSASRSWPRPYRNPARRRNSLRFRPAPGSSRRRAPSADNGRYFEASGSTASPLRRTGTSSARPTVETTLRASVSVSRRILEHAAAGEPMQQAPAEREPDRERGVEPSRQQQHRPRPDKAERRGLAGRQADAVHGKPAGARKRRDAGVVASAAGAADDDDKVRAAVGQRRVQVAVALHDLAATMSRVDGDQPRRRGNDGVVTQRQARERAGRERSARKFPRRPAPRDRSRAASRRRGAAAACRRCRRPPARRRRRD